MSARTAARSIRSAARNVKSNARATRASAPLKIVVRNVLVGDEARTVRFIARPVRSGLVVCRTRGLPKLRIMSSDGGRSFEVECPKHGAISVPGRNPAKAFAAGVREFWAS